MRMRNWSHTNIWCRYSNSGAGAGTVDTAYIYSAMRMHRLIQHRASCTLVLSLFVAKGLSTAEGGRGHVTTYVYVLCIGLDIL